MRIWAIFLWSSSKNHSRTNWKMRQTSHHKNHHCVPWTNTINNNVRRCAIMKWDQGWHQFYFFINDAIDRIRNFNNFLIDESLFGEIILVFNDCGVPCEKTGMMMFGFVTSLNWTNFCYNLGNFLMKLIKKSQLNKMKNVTNITSQRPSLCSLQNAQ